MAKRGRNKSDQPGNVTEPVQPEAVSGGGGGNPPAVPLSSEGGEPQVSPDASVPAVASSIASPPPAEGSPATRGQRAAAMHKEHKLPFDEKAEDVHERMEKKPTRQRDMMNEAVGADIYCLDWTERGWELKNGNRFGVSRYYPHAKVVIDMPRNEREEFLCPEKMSMLNRMGIVYVLIPLKHGLTIEDIREIITHQRVELSANEGE